jgi:hypothetical protein
MNTISLNKSIASRLEEVFLIGKWIANTNYKEQLSGIDWQRATKKVGDLNSIAALTFHINYYLDGLLKAFETGKLEISDKFSFNLPVIDNQDDWEQLQNEFYKNAQAFANWVNQMDENLLYEDFIDPKYGTYLRNIEGVLEHSYYHLGQISLIHKLLRI